VNIIIIFALALGFGGWVIHLYTLLLSYFSDEKWTCRVSFNYYHEAWIEVILFTALCIFFIFLIVIAIGEVIL